jgi:hypothetical protein
MTRIAAALLVAPVLLATTVESGAFDSDNDTGWGAPYNSHLDPYNGRPLGPPLPSLPPGYQYYNGRLVRVPYAAPGRVYVPYAPAPAYSKRKANRR